MIQFNQNGWLKPYNDINTDLIMQLIGNAVFGKTMENVKKNIKILYLLQQKEEGISISNRNEEKKTEKLMNKPVHLGLSILGLSKILCMNFRMIMQNPNMI